ncbi:hypothetical protein OG982_28050 [Streptomyces sp. NBC_01551]|uniref:hypothetical protein n=1 Tax=Streptomyces sp. NBC_01551 TaxID=2975876 RepID=UPI00225126EF|nr:hypothetical protein [Streptomyces sp. NBC_01551]MCX4529505.1 hypothetical protein [Streptomyces sp. NBC_01551]
MKKIIVTGMLALAGASLAAPAHADGGSAVPGVDSLPLNSLANTAKDPLNSTVAHEGGAGGLTSSLGNLDQLTSLLNGLLKGAPISGAATPGHDASGEAGSPLGSAGPLSALTGGGDKGSPLGSLTGGLSGIGGAGGPS